MARVFFTWALLLIVPFALAATDPALGALKRAVKGRDVIATLRLVKTVYPAKLSRMERRRTSRALAELGRHHFDPQLPSKRQRQRNVERAEALLQAALRFDTQVVAARLLEAELHQARKAFPEAAAALRKARGLAPTDASIMVLSAELARAEGKLEEAEGAFRDARDRLEKDPRQDDDMMRLRRRVIEGLNGTIEARRAEANKAAELSLMPIEKLAERKRSPGENNAEVVVYGAAWCEPCHDARRWLESQGQAYRYVDVDDERGRRELQGRLRKAKLNAQVVPIIAIGEELLVGFEPRRLKAVLGLR